MVSKRTESLWKNSDRTVSWQGHTYKSTVFKGFLSIAFHKDSRKASCLSEQGSTKGFFRYIGHKRQAKEGISPLINEKGKLATTDIKRYTTNSLPQSLPTVRLPMSLMALKFLVGLKEQNPSHCSGRASQRPLHETECVQDYGSK